MGRMKKILSVMAGLLHLGIPYWDTQNQAEPRCFRLSLFLFLRFFEILLGANATMLYQAGSNSDSLDLIERNLVAAPVVEAGGAGRLMGCHLLGDLQPSTIL
jgi:hypothetical protein